MPINPSNPDALTFARALGAEHITGLDFEMGRRRIECHRIDYGPGGLIAAQRRVVYAELGLAPPATPEAVLRQRSSEAVREALRNFRVPHELARSPLATGQRRRSGPSPFARCCGTRRSAPSGTTRTRSCCSGC